MFRVEMSFFGVNSVGLMIVFSINQYLYAQAQNSDYSLPAITAPMDRWQAAKTGRSMPAADRLTVAVYLTSECPMVQKYRPELRRLATELGNSVAWRFVYPAADAKRALAHFKSSKLSGEAVFEPDYMIAKQCGVKVTTGVLLFDAKGLLRYRGRIDDRGSVMGEWKDRATRRDLLQAVRDLQAKRAVAITQTDAVGCFLPFLVEDH
jgi:hypothetical protein